MAYQPSGNDPRGRQQNMQNYLQGQQGATYGPIMNNMWENYGRGTEQGFQDYGNIQGGYDQIMGMPQPGMMPQPTNHGYMAPSPQMNGPQQAPSQEAIMSLFPNGMTPEALKAAQPQLLQMGIHLQNEARGDLRPRMLMPNGETVDLGAWGGPAQWQNRGNIGDW